MEGHPSASTATCGERLARTTTMCGCITSRGGRACAVAHLSNASLSLSEVHTFAPHAKNSLRGEKCLLAMYSPPWKVAESDVNRRRNLNWLATLEGQRKGNIAPAIARLGVERLVKIF